MARCTDIGSMQRIKDRYSAPRTAWKRKGHMSGKEMKTLCVCVCVSLAAAHGTILTFSWDN